MSNLTPIPNNSRKATKYRGVTCLNCNQPLDLSDVYCSYCGQLNTTKKLSFGDFFREFFSSIINYDSKLRFTIKDLLFKPGKISKNYIEGKRSRYANPFRFYLSVSIIYFLIQGLVLMVEKENNFIHLNKKENEKVVAINLDKDTIKVDSTSLNTSTLPYEYIKESSLDTLGYLDKQFTKWSYFQDFYDKTQISDPDLALDSLKYKKTGFNKWLYSKNNSVKKIEEDPISFLSYLQSKVPFFIFFFAPIYALFFWLIYAKKKYNYMEHLVFIFHIFGFVFLALLICLIPEFLLKTDFLSGIFFVIIGPFYLYKALRNFYKQSRIITLIKFVILNITFLLSITFIALLFFSITAAAY